MNVRQKLMDLQDDIALSVLDRREEIHSAVLSLLARQHMFLLGTPGTAKSRLFDQLTARIVDGKSFKWQLNKFSVPEEVFGGPDLKTLEQTGVYRRITDGKLPQAHVGWVDEVFKANPSILNALLLIINEREFINPGDDPHVPLISLFTASNEMPQNAELEALVDRLLIRHIVEPLQDPALIVEMLGMEDRDPEVFITLEEIETAQQQVSQVVLNDQLFEAVLELKDKLDKEGIGITDRRLRQSMSIVKAEAWLNGREIAEVVDTRPLAYVFWREPGQFDTVRKIVMDVADPIERKVLKLRDELETAYSEFRKVMEDEDNEYTRAKQSMQTYGYFKKARTEFQQLRDEQIQSGRGITKSLDDMRRRLKELGPKILAEGVGLPDAAEIDSAIENRTEGF